MLNLSAFFLFEDKQDMPEYIYNYFNVRGRGELARLVFAAAGVDYNDNRIPNEAWEENDCVNDIVKGMLTWLYRLFHEPNF